MTNQLSFLSSDIPQPKVFTNKNDKTISVNYRFGVGRLPSVKIIASWRKWRDWESKRKWSNGGHNLRLITFEDVRPFLSPQTPTKLIRRLRRYAKEEQSNFVDELYNCILAANDTQVKYKAKFKTDICKTRGRLKSYAEFEQEEKKKRSGISLRTIRIAAKQLYVFLRCGDSNDRLNLIAKYGIKNPENITEAVKVIIEEVYYPFEMIVKKLECDESFNEFEMFYRKYIADDRQKLERLSKDSHIKEGKTTILKKILSYNPQNNPTPNKSIHRKNLKK